VPKGIHNGKRGRKPCALRLDAMVAGAVRYSTGKPCGNGHVAHRLTSTGTCVECLRIGARVYRAAHPGKARTSVRLSTARLLSDPEARRRRRIQMNKSDHARRAAKTNAGGIYTVDDIVRLTNLQKGRCACCGKRRKLTVDHIVPLARGGSNGPTNLQMLCVSCNSSKGSRDAVAFMQGRGLLI
jgi:5-methylcytosine-specific restriction endonuclease McrA